jgi:hypothetical protein
LFWLIEAMSLFFGELTANACRLEDDAPLKSGLMGFGEVFGERLKR